MRNTNWVFGQRAGLHFSGTIIPFSNRPINTAEGCAAISDASGNLILYSDGVTTMDGAGAVQASGLLGNHSSTQAACIVPDPGDPMQFYVFTSDASGGTNHVNGILINSSSWVSTPITFTPTPPTAGYSPTEKLVAIRHANQNDFWVLTLVRPAAFQSNTGPGTLRVFLVDSNGVHYMGDQALGQMISDVGYMKASPGGRRIAMANYWVANLLVIPFSNSSGTISLAGLINIPTTPVPSPHNAMCPYGVEFSSRGELLYYTTIYPLGIVNSPTTDGLVYQFFLPSGPPVLIGAHPRATASDDVGALQFGSDGRIYIAQNGQHKLGIIAHPNAFGAACGLTFNAVSLAKGSACNYGLPNFIRDLF